ncbi:DegT/DnrJ/EryC1/StrS family aminotransferase [Enterococcus dispar]|uniref:DegT/DnrJ/EryC1/StrS family aminotransferase n=1 Tax=Enterococcus dispar TaxID=44009 RepID=UPI00232F8276|nr:DegT/DnrJ/EryC1/StrS family aminotransferase [Enterococcus dispar]WCG34071.1 DegT/DnrJ/EryC1/StrS family aminotransferase [Enterococcus dispar]
MKNIPFSPPDITELEIANVVDVLKSGWITTGPKTKEFEKRISEYCGTQKTNCLNSATASMEMCLRMLGVGPGDEVITSAYTYTASASVIDHVGAKIVLVDTDPGTYHLSYEKMADAITEKTKVIIPVDIAGVPCDYERIFEIVESKREIFKAKNEIQSIFNRVIVLADAAHSFGAIYKSKMVGSVADFTSFSFHAVKNITTAEGGALTWKSLGDEIDNRIYSMINQLSLHGQSKDALSKTQLGSWEYDIISPAFKCNMTDIQAAIGLGQLERITDMYKRRQEVAKKYYEISSLDFIRHSSDDFTSSHHLMLASVKKGNRDELITYLANLGIACNVHYKPLPLLTAYKNLGFSMDAYPNSFEMYQKEITLPLHSLLTDDQVKYICDSVARYELENV